MGIDEDCGWQLGGVQNSRENRGLDQREVADQVEKRGKACEIDRGN